MKLDSRECRRQREKENVIETEIQREIETEKRDF